MQYDHNSEVFRFRIPATIEGHPVSSCDSRQIHYINTGIGTSVSNRETKPGIYEIPEFTGDTDDPNYLYFDWPISQNATQLVGDLKFQIKLGCTNPYAPGVIDYMWGSQVYSAVEILPGINNTEIVVTEYTDILEQWNAEIAQSLADMDAKIDSMEVGSDVGQTTPNKGEIFNDYENNAASSEYSHAEGNTTSAFGESSHTEGYNTRAGIMGYEIESVDRENRTIVLKTNEGISPGMSYYDVEGDYLYTNRVNTIETVSSDGKSIVVSKKLDQMAAYMTHITIKDHPELGHIGVKGKYSHAEGNGTTTSGEASHAEGYNTTAFGKYSHAEGKSTTASGEYTHAEGGGTIASYEYSHAEGSGTTASEYAAHAEGWGTKATNSAAHAEGESTTASGSAAHAEGENTVAFGCTSHAEGTGTAVYGDYSHGEGEYTQANAWGCHAEGSYTKASGDYQHVQGKYNIEDTAGQYAHIVGNGDSITRSNAHTLDWDGNAWFAGTVEGTALILKSPSGNRFKITVDDNGVLSTAKI